MIHNDSSGYHDSMRACVLLADRIAEKFGVTVKAKQPLPRITPAELAKIRAQGFRVERAAPPSPSWLQRARSIFADTPPVGGRPVNPRILRAIAAVWEAERAHGGKMPHGMGRKIAQKFAVNYGTLMDRLSIERALAKTRKEAA